MAIDDYAFGRMTIDGRVYTTDLMILPDGRVLSDWWRRRGHAVGAADLEPVLSCDPAVLVIGTGADGRMHPDPGLPGDLEARGIRLVAVPTAEAMACFNHLPPEFRRAAAFHLTC
ncbi:MAG: MTH938/NDUFAF3 family protein [Pseudomonadota bacterium]